MIVNKISKPYLLCLISSVAMITRGVRTAALQALVDRETTYWDEHPKEWGDLADRWDGYQWNMVGHMVQDCLWDELTHHLLHTLKETHIRDQILHLLWQSAPGLCRTLGLAKTP